MRAEAAEGVKPGQPRLGEKAYATQMQPHYTLSTTVTMWLLLSQLSVWWKTQQGSYRLSSGHLCEAIWLPPEIYADLGSPECTSLA